MGGYLSARSAFWGKNISLGTWSLYRLAIAKKVYPLNPHIHWLFQKTFELSQRKLRTVRCIQVSVLSPRFSEREPFFDANMHRCFLRILGKISGSGRGSQVLASRDRICNDVGYLGRPPLPYCQGGMRQFERPTSFQEPCWVIYRVLLPAAGSSEVLRCDA